MPFLSLNGRRIFYEEHGQGEPLVLMHHGFGCSAMWKEVYPKLVEAGWRVILYDRRGYGQSDPGEDYAEFYLSDGFRAAMVEDMAQVLGKLVGGPVNLVGQCEGGVTSVDFAVAHPEMVKSLVLGSVQTWSMVEMTAFNAEKFPKSFSELSPELREKFTHWHGPEWAPVIFEMARTAGGAYGTGFFDLRPQLKQVACPALVIYPDRSALFPVDQGVGMYQALPQGELAVMAMCGHNTYEYRPWEYARHVLEFHERLAQAAVLDETSPAGAKLDPNQTCAS